MKKRKDTRERILMQALAYFTVQDYDRISLNDIAGALGITKGGIYHYFGSKDELFKEALLFTIGRLEHQYEEIMVAYRGDGSGKSLKEILSLFFIHEKMGDQTAVSVGVDVYKEYENLVYLLFVGIRKFPEVRTRIDEVYGGQLQKLQNLFEKAKRAGEVRKELNSQAVAFEVIALVEGSLLVRGLVRSLSLEKTNMLTFEQMWQRISVQGE